MNRRIRVGKTEKQRERGRGAEPGEKSKERQRKRGRGREGEKSGEEWRRKRARQ